jgi:head-tail adaptor
MKTVVTLYIDAEILRRTKELIEGRTLSRKIEGLLEQWLELQGYTTESEKSLIIERKKIIEKQREEADNELTIINSKLAAIDEQARQEHENAEAERQQREAEAAKCLRCRDVSAKMYATKTGKICAACFMVLTPGEAKQYGL